MNARTASPECAGFHRLNRLRNSPLGFLPGIDRLLERAFRKARPALQEPIEVRLGSFTMFALPHDPVVSERIILHRRWEKRQSALVRRLLAPGHTFCDVGANIGYYSLMAAALVGPRGQVLAFEPDPGHAELLRRSAARNGFDNVGIQRMALSDRGGRGELFRNPANSGNQSLLAANNSSCGESVTVAIDTLDGFLERHPPSRPIDLLKVDVEGAEGLVLRGARRALANPSVKVLMEFWPEGSRRFGVDPAQLLQELGEMGFALFEVGAKGVPVPMTAAAALDREGHNAQVDMLLMRR
ncbi:MAG: FkbM family methyltransferase [Planctomycetes bacterium]|nr:FkbM family methyltransferase [Planctomycetota bacterium]